MNGKQCFCLPVWPPDWEAEALFSVHPLLWPGGGIKTRAVKLMRIKELIAIKTVITVQNFNENMMKRQQSFISFVFIARQHTDAARQHTDARYSCSKSVCPLRSGIR